MRAAPPVQIERRHTRLQRLLVLALYALAGASLAAWAVGHGFGASGAASMVGAAAVGAGLAAVGGALGPAPWQGRIAWDGQRWSLHPVNGEPVEGRLQIMMDVGPALILRFRPFGAHAAGMTWLVASRRDAGAAWTAFRSAVYCAAQDSAADGSASTDRCA